MIRINKLTDYAVVVLAEMAGEPDKVITAPRLAGDTNLPLPTVAKLMKSLAHGGILVSHRGAGGGYVLGRNANDITVAEIISALEGPISLTECVDGTEGDCEVESLCPMRGNWDKVNAAIRQALSEVTIADMAVTPLSFGPPPGEAGFGAPQGGRA